MCIMFFIRKRSVVVVAVVASEVQQTRGGLMATFCQFKPCDKATFGHKNLKTVTHFAKIETFALSIKAARSKTT